MAKPEHSDKWKSCVHKVGNNSGAYNPYAVCTNSIGQQCQAEMPFVNSFTKKPKESLGSSGMPQLTRGGVIKL